MNNLLELKKELKKLENPQRARISQGFFKTGKGEYGEGDIFVGLTVPQSRGVAMKFKNLPFSEILELLKSKIHEERLIALFILVFKFDQANKLENVGMNKKIYNFYLKNTKCVNNWDLVDLSADKIVGGFIFGSAKKISNFKFLISNATPPILIKLARSKNLWERRIAMVATYYFIKNNKFNLTLEIAEILLNDKHDLIHKAVGWMLREVGKRSLETEIKFLNKHYRQMPRVMLRYAIERFPERLRMDYLSSFPKVELAMLVSFSSFNSFL